MEKSCFWAVSDFGVPLLDLSQEGRAGEVLTGPKVLRTVAGSLVASAWRLGIGVDPAPTLRDHPWSCTPTDCHMGPQFDAFNGGDWLDRGLLGAVHRYLTMPPRADVCRETNLPASPGKWPEEPSWSEERKRRAK